MTTTALDPCDAHFDSLLDPYPIDDFDLIDTDPWYVEGAAEFAETMIRARIAEDEDGGLVITTYNTWDRS
jgi:hypothetical protein